MKELDQLTSHGRFSALTADASKRTEPQAATRNRGERRGGRNGLRFAFSSTVEGWGPVFLFEELLEKEKNWNRDTTWGNFRCPLKYSSKKEALIHNCRPRGGHSLTRTKPMRNPEEKKQRSDPPNNRHVIGPRVPQCKYLT